MKNSRAAAYIRVSTDEQTEYSPAAQMRAIMKYAAENGYTLTKENIYSDEGISGRRAEKRPGFMKMIGAAKAKERPFDVILVHRFDRFARSREDSVVYKSLLKKQYGIRVISVTESIDNDKFSVILEAMLEAMAEYYSINLSDEVKKGMTEKAMRGEYQAGPPYGYRIMSGMLVIDEQEAETVREIFSRFISGETVYRITKELNIRGIKTRRKNDFERRAVEYILNNPVYAGLVRWNPNGRTDREFYNSGLIIKSGSHEPVIDDDTWIKACQRFESIKKGARAYGGAMSPLSGIIRCSNCGSAMVYIKPGYLKCSGFIKGKCRVSQHVKFSDIYGALKKALLDDMAASADIPITAVKCGDSVELERMRDSLSIYKKAEKRLLELYLRSGIDGNEYAYKKRELEREISLLREEISLFEANENTDFLSFTEEDFERFPPERINSALKAVIEKCVWDKSQGRLDIIYRQDIFENLFRKEDLTGSSEHRLDI